MNPVNTLLRRVRATRLPPARALPGGAALAILSIATPAETAAQSAAAILEIFVIGAGAGQPIPGAQVTIVDGSSARTDESGQVRFPGLAPIDLTVEIRALGYHARSLTMDLPAGQTFHLTIPLEPEPILLPEVRIEGDARRGEIRSRELRDFYRRVRVGAGQYLTRTDIERRRPRNLTDLIRMLPGFVIVGTAAGEKPTMEAKASASAELSLPQGACPIQYFLDGAPMVPLHGGVIDAEVELGEIEGVEIYRRGSAVPAKFHRYNNSCGVILIWKKERI